MHIYRSHTCNALTKDHVGQNVRLSGWVSRIRDHGGLLFLDLRDGHGLTQCVIDSLHSSFKELEDIALESIVTIDGTVVLRDLATVNTSLTTGDIEVKIENFTIQSLAESLPFPVNHDAGYPENIRLRYRFLDLRRQSMHDNIVLRSKIILSLRKHMVEQNFTEIQTPILTASSPEGARDFLVPSRLHPGKFYALPQAPQQFKQLLMVAGFDRYFQIAPCFRDEDARADRSPGEFYQLDFEMSFVTQEDVFRTLEPVLCSVFKEFSPNKAVTPAPFPRIPYREAMVKYGSDKPDLRNPIEIGEVSDVFCNCGFKVFADLVKKGCVVRAIPAPKAANRPRSFFDKLNSWARENGQAGLGYIQFKEEGALGPIAKNLESSHIKKIKERLHLSSGDAVFFVCGAEKDITPFTGIARTKIAEELGIVEKNVFKFCWIVDFPMYEYDENLDKIVFSHNPFSMPQGGMEALETKDPLDILAYQYDIVCNGIELSSGAIRNHLPEIMYKAFNIAGYTQDFIHKNFSGMINAFKYGSPPHGGAAPGIDRMVMLLTGESNIRQVIAFPLNQNAEDVMLNAPSEVTEEAKQEIHIRTHKPPEIEKQT